MAKPTKEEIKRMRLSLEAEMVGGLSSLKFGTDIKGMPTVKAPSSYLDIPFPVGESMGAGTKQAKLAKLTDLQLELAKENWKEQGYPFSDEDITVKRAELYKDNYKKIIRPALPNIYGDFDEKTKEGPSILLGGAAKIPDAPSMSSKPEEGKDGFLDAAANALSVQSKSVDKPTKTFDIDWDAVKKDFLKEEINGKNPTEAEAVEYIKDQTASYETYKSMNKRTKPEAMINKYNKFMFELGQVKPIEKPQAIKDEFKQKGTSAAGQATSQQVTNKALEIPDYSKNQMMFLKKRIADNAARIEKQTKDTYSAGDSVEGVVVNLNPTGSSKTSVTATGRANTASIPTAMYYAIQMKNPALPGYVPVVSKTFDAKIYGQPILSKENTILKTPETIGMLARATGMVEAGDPDIWWLNGDAKKELLTNPSKYIKQGWTQDVSPFGDVKETKGMYGVRMAMAPLNVIASGLQQASEIAIGTGMGAFFKGAELVGAVGEMDAETEGSYFDPMEMSRVRQKVRAEKMPLYANQEVWGNVATNKGFMGEAEDIVHGMNITGWQKGVIIGGGLLMDIASPDIAIIGGLGKAAGVGMGLTGTGRLNKALYGTNPTAINKLYDALGAGTDTFLNDLNGISAIYKKMNPKHIPYGSGTGKAANELEEILRLKRLEQTVDVDEFSMIEAALRKKNPNHPYFAYQDARNQSGTDGLLDIIKNEEKTGRTSSKLLDEWSSTQEGLSKLERGASLEEVIITTKLDREFLDAASLSATGKKFSQLSDISIDVVRGAIDRNYARLLTLNHLGPKKLAKLNDIVGITAKTWANKKDIGKLIATANGTPLGKLLAKIRDVGTTKVDWKKQIPFAGTKNPPMIDVGRQKFGFDPFKPDSEFVSGSRESSGRHFQLDEATSDELWELLSNSRQSNDARLLMKDIRENQRISFDDFNRLVDMNLDNSAKLGDSYSLEQIGKLGDEAQDIILRGKPDNWATAAGKKFISAFMKNDRISDNNIPLTSIEHKRLYNSISARASLMDTQLRRELDKLIGDVKTTTRKEYGVPDSVTSLNSDEAMGYLIYGKLDSDPDAPTKSLKWLIGNLFYDVKQKPAYFDQLFGTNQLKSDTLLSANGKQAWEDIVNKFIETNRANKGRFLDNLYNAENGLLKQYDDFIDPVTNRQNLRIGIHPDEIVKLDKKIKGYDNTLGRKFGFGSVESELQIGMYYAAEAGRIIEDEIIKSVSDGILKLDTDSIVGQDTIDAVASILGASGKANPDEVFRIEFEAITKKLVNRNLNDPHPKNWDLIRDLASKDDGIRMYLSGITSADEMAIMVKQLTQDQQVLVAAAATAVRKADETAEIILRNNNLSHNKFVATADDALAITEMVMDNKTFAKAILGDEAFAAFARQASEGNISGLTHFIDSALSESKTIKGLALVKEWMVGVNSFFYTMVLSFRNSFHGNNVISAPAIVYQTTGTLGAFNPRLVNKGRNLAFSATNPSDKFFYEVATIDKSGKVWTYGALNKKLNAAGVQSRYDFMTSLWNSEKLKVYMKKHSSRNKGIYDLSTPYYNKLEEFLGGATVKEDLSFRSAVMIEALEDGKNIDEATNLARRSLFDYNDMPNWEKAFAAKYFIFYAFTRQNFGQFLKATGDPQMMKRYLMHLKLKRGSGKAGIAMFGGDTIDDDFFYDDNTSSKLLLGIVGDEKKTAIWSPNLPALDAPTQLFNLLYNPKKWIGETATGFLKPGTKRLLDIKNKFDYEPKNIPAELIVPFDTTGAATIALYEKLLGGDIVMVPGKNGEKGVVNGWQFNLDADQKKKLAGIMQKVNMTGAISFYRDWYKLFSAEGTTPAAVSPLLRPFTKQTEIKNNEYTEYYNAMTRKKELEKQISDKTYQLKSKRRQEE